MASQGQFDAERLRRLQVVTDAALAHLQLDDLLDALLRRTGEILEVDTVAFLMLDVATDELVARATLGIEDGVEHGVRIPFGRGFAGRIAATREPVVLDNVDDSDVLNPVLVEKHVKSMLGVPLIVEGRVIGVLHVGSLTPRLFDADDVELLQLVGDRAAIAIEHARVFEAERFARERIEAVQSVTDAALGILELDELLHELLVRIRDALDADTAAFLLLDHAEDEVVARSAVGLEEEVEAGVRIPLGAGFAGRVAAEREPVVIRNLDDFEVVNPILREKGLRSMLGVPLLVRGDVLGVVHVGSLHLREFTHSDVELLQLVAERAALAIETARVHEETVRLDQMKLNFVAVASHELRTPATAVYGIATTLRQRADVLDEEQKALLEETLWSQSDRLRRLIEQLLDLSRLDARAVRVEPVAIDVAPVLREVVRSTAAGAEGVHVEVADGLIAEIDPLVVDRVVTNLVGNALRYGAPPVVVTAAQVDRHLRIAVCDSGGGVPEQLVPRLFDRFQRGDSGEGTGLGLAIAKTYAAAHGGDLVYDLTPSGPRFEFILPNDLFLQASESARADPDAQNP